MDIKDDVTVFAGYRSSFEQMITLISKFEGLSGLSINNNKSSIMWLGSMDDKCSQIDNIKISSVYNTLGVWFAYHAEPNLPDVLVEPTDHFRSREKLQYLKSWFPPCSNIMCSILYTPSRVFEEVRTHGSAFLWGKGCSKLAYTTLIQSIENAGLRLADLETCTKVNHIRWVTGFIRKPHSFPAKFLQFLTNSTNPPNLLLGKQKRSAVKKNIFSPFYAAVIRTWSEFHSFYPAEEEEISREYLWDNFRISHHNVGTPMMRSQWEKAGITTVQDVCHHNENRLLSHEEKLHVPCNFLNALQLSLSITVHWRAALTADFKGDTNPRY